MPIPLLETERLLIRPFSLDDLEELHRILDYELLWSGEPLSLDDRREVLEGNIAAYNLDVPCGWRAIAGRPDGALLGMVRLNVDLLSRDVRSLFAQAEAERAHNTLETFLGYALSPAYWGHGFATEAARAMVGYAFQGMNLARVLAETEEANERSQRVMQKLGMALACAPRPGWPDRVVGWLERTEFHL